MADLAEIKKMDRSEYLNERRALVGLEADAYKNFDKTLLTISSGAIALSVAFVDKLHFATTVYLLVSSWVLWFISILLQLFSFIVTSKAMREELAILNEQYKDYSKEPRKNKYSGKPSILNFVALTAFGLGTFSFIVFILFNLDRIIK